MTSKEMNIVLNEIKSINRSLNTLLKLVRPSEPSVYTKILPVGEKNDETE